MPNDNGVVTVTTTEKQEPYAINGTMVTVCDAIDKFFGEDHDVLDTNAVSLNGRTITEEDFDKELRANDVILVVAKNLASGGIKGA